MGRSRDSRKTAGLIAPSRLKYSLQKLWPPSFSRITLDKTFSMLKLVCREYFSTANADCSAVQKGKNRFFLRCRSLFVNMEDSREEGMSPHGPGVAVRGDVDKKAPSRGKFKLPSGLGPWQPCGPRRFARQVVTTQAVGFDSRAVHPHILTQTGIGESIREYQK